MMFINGSNVTCPFDDLFPTFYHLIASTKIPLCMIGVTFNAVEVYIFTSKELHGRSSYLLAAISCCNFLFTLWNLVDSVFTVIGKWNLVDVGGLAWYIIDAIAAGAVGASIWLVVWLAVERYIAVCRPLYTLTPSKRRDVFVIFVIFCFAAILPFMRAINIGIIPTSGNGKVVTRYMWKVLYIVIPAAVIIATLVPLIRTLGRRIKFSRRGIGREMNVTNSERATKVVISIASIFLITNSIPRFAILIINAHIIRRRRDGELCYISEGWPELTFLYVMVILEMLSFVSLDSLVYFSFNRAYRRKFQEAFCCVQKPPLTTNHTCSRSGISLYDSDFHKAITEGTYLHIEPLETVV